MNRQAFRRKYIHHRNLLMKGYAEFGAIIGVWNSAILLWLALSSVFDIPKQYAWVAFLAIPVILGCLYVYGRFYYKFGFLHEEARWYSEENPAYRRMMSAIEKGGNEKHEQA